MRVFLSYGHDQNAPLVERIGRDLKAAGHEVWIDQSEIKAGEDWRRSIIDGLSDTDWVLGFLSKHSTRDPGVCLDELAIALHTKGGAIATVLVESEGAVEPPVSVSHIQWLDMHDWAERQDGGMAWENWYHGKLDGILNLLASPATQRFAGEIEELDRRLKPIAQEADIGLLADGFVGREWLHTTLDEWRRHSKDSRLFWLSGAAGTGKSAFAAWLAHRGKVNVIGLNLCRYNIDDRRDPGRVIRTLTFQIATRLPDYRRLLLDKLTVQDPGGDELARKGPSDLFGFLLIETLRLAIDGGRRDDRYLIVIDGLDETVRDGRNELAEILAEQAKKLPAWIAILVTSRPEEPILRQFGELQPHWIRAESPENLGDLRIYAREWLAGLDLPQSEALALIDRVLAASQGNFLYLRMLREAVTAGTLSVFAPEGLPRGLIGLYERWFRRQYPDRQIYEAHVPVLAVLAAAEHPVPESWLARMFAWSKREEARMLEGLGSLFERRADGLAPFHKSLRDWLIDPRSAGADFVVDEADGTRRLATTLWAEFVRWALAEDSGGLDPFCVTELPAQIARSRSSDIKALLASSSPWSTIRPGLVRTAKSQTQNFAWEAALGWWQSTATLANTSGDEALPDQAAAFAEAGDILMTLGRSAAALTSYQASLVIADRLAKADPGNAGWQRDLSVSHNKIGEVQSAQGDLAAALTSYQASHDIFDRLAKADPGNAGWRRDLSVSHNNIGDVQRAQGDLAAALTSYQASHDIFDRLAKADPGNAGWQRDLSVSHNKIGDVQRAQGDLAAALTSYQASHDIFDRLAKADPGNAGWQRDLSVSHNKIGDVQRAQGDLAAALTSYQASLAIRDRLAKADPGNAGWQRDLSVSHNNIGDVQRAQGDLAAALTSYQASLAIRDRLAKADPGNAGWQRDLSVSHDKIGDVQRAQGDLAAALTSYQASLAIADRLAKADPGNAGWQRDLSVSHERIGDVQSAQGDLAAALTSYQASLAIRDRLAKADPGNAGWRRDLSVSHDKIGDVQRAQGDLAAALTSYQVSLAIRDRLAKADPGNAGWQRDLSVSHNNIGDVQRAQGDLAAALTSYQVSLAIRDRLAKADPGNAGWQSDLSVSQDNIGEVQSAQGDLAAALTSYQASLAIRDRLAKADPGNAGWQRDLSVSQERIGDVQSAQGDLAAALTSYQASLAIRDRLAKADPGNAGWQRDLSVSHNKIGDAQSTQGDLAAALTSYHASLAIRGRLAKADPGNAGWRRDLSVSHNNIGDVQRAQGDLAAALTSYQASLAIADRLAKADPGNAGWQRDLALSYGRVGIVEAEQGGRDQARGMLQQGREIIARLTRQSPSNVTLLNDLAWFDAVVVQFAA